MRAWPKFEWSREALNEAAFGRVALCFGMIAKLEQAPFEAIIEPYLIGLTLVAKSDLHLNFAGQACHYFAKCLSDGMRHFGTWDGTETDFPAAISGFFGAVLRTSNDIGELLDLLSHVRRQPPDLVGITLERAASLKVLCDAYMISQFQKMAQADGSLRERASLGGAAAK